MTVGEIDGVKLGKLLRLPRPVQLVNDFEAVGHGLLTLDTESDEEVMVLQPGASARPNVPTNTGGTIGVVGAGTGFGAAFLTAATGERYSVHPTEGGHVDWSPRGEAETGFHDWLRWKY
eukprot:SAG31_NODE_22167_length_532_cov_0.946882_2_plen_118_part_01